MESAPAHSILGTALLPVAEVLGVRGVDAGTLLLETGIDPAELSRPEYRVSLERYHRLMRRCVEETGDEAFGLHCAEALQPQVLHGLGLGWLASDTVYDGLRRLVRFGQLIASMAELHLEEQGELVHLHLRASQQDELEYAGRDYGVAMVTRMCRLNLGKYLSPYQVEFQRPLPEHPETWESMLASRVSFDCDRTCITWARADIVDRLVTGDPALARVNDEQAQSLIDSYIDDSTTRQVVDRIVFRLPDGPPAQDLIAGDLCMSNRTLQRKLKEENASFSELLQNCRMELAKKYIRQQDRSVAEISYSLGFAEPSAFNRAFKRWTGTTPVQYRAADSAADRTA